MCMRREGVPNIAFFQNCKAHDDLAGLYDIRMDRLENNALI